MVRLLLVIQWDIMTDRLGSKCGSTVYITCCLLILQDYWLDFHCLLWEVKLLDWFLCVLTYLELFWTGISLSYY